ncbi:MAG: (Fe-S)-binding protein [Myxococcota bacterium]
MTIRLTAKAQKAAAFCTYCPKMCRFACPVAEAEARETVTPWGLMGLLFAVREEGVTLSSEVGEAFYHCTSCMRCQTYCRHDNDVPSALLEARQALVDRGLPTPEPLQGLDLHMEEHGSPFGPVPELEAKEEVFEADAEVVFVPACTRRAHMSESVLTAGRVLAQLLSEPVALLEAVGGKPTHCCGGALREAGYASQAEDWQDRVMDAVQGYRLVVTDCATLLGSLRDRPGAPQAEHLAEAMARGLEQRAEPLAPVEATEVFWHDACTVGRRLGVYDAPRRLMAAAHEEPTSELWQCREKARCCGGGGHYPRVDPEGAAQAAEVFMDDLRQHGAQTVVTVESQCIHHLQSQGPWEVDVVDLVERVAQALGASGSDAL